MKNIRRTLICLVLALACIFLLVGCGKKDAAKEAELRFDGLYCYIYTNEKSGLRNNSALRFYPDGVVISVSIAQRNEESGLFPNDSWFNRDDERISSILGSYEYESGVISIVDVSSSGTVDRWGEVHEGYMVLSSHSNINGHDSTDLVFEFYPFDEIEGWYR